MTTRRIIMLTVKPLMLGLIGFSMVKMGVFNISGGGGLQNVYEAVSFTFVMSLCVGGLFFSPGNNKRMILEYTALMLVYYSLFYLAVFPWLAGISPYLALWADVIASLPVMMYCYYRTVITAKLIAWLGPHCYIQDKYLNLMARPGRALYQRGFLPGCCFNGLVRALGFFRKNGTLQQRLARLIANTRTTGFTFFCLAFTGASLLVDVFFACWGDVYGLLNQVPFDGTIWRTLLDNGDVDFFLLWDAIQQGMAGLFPVAIMGYLVMERKERA